MEKKVIVYSTSWCGFCSAEKDWLEHNGIKFEAKDIEEDSKAREELLEKMGGEFRGVPVTDVNGEIVLGFDRARLSKLLDIKRF